MSKQSDNRKPNFPEDPSGDGYFELPSDCDGMVNTFGTYNIQRTADTGNLFPAIGQGLPENTKKAKYGKG